MKKILIPVISAKIDYYIAAIKRQGDEPVVVNEKGDAVIADALLLPGGADVDPARYGEEINGAEKINKDLDDLQFSYLDAFIKAGKPVFGICRGLQVINVYFGGTLIQNITDRDIHAKKSLLDRDRYHDAKVSGKDSFIYEIFHQENLYINSSHHEAVKAIGKGLTADLWSTAPEDSCQILEAMHHETLPVWAVQFHPERCLSEFKESALIDGNMIFHYWASQI